MAKSWIALSCIHATLAHDCRRSTALLQWLLTGFVILTLETLDSKQAEQWWCTRSSPSSVFYLCHPCTGLLGDHRPLRQKNSVLAKFLKSMILTPSNETVEDDLAAFRIPENEALLRPRFPIAATYSYSATAARHRPVDGHPDMNQYFWFEAGLTIPSECRWIFRGNASFIHVSSKIVFAFPSGTHTISIRLPLTAVSDDMSHICELNADGNSVIWIDKTISLEDDKRLLHLAFECAERKT